MKINIAFIIILSFYCTLLIAQSHPYELKMSHEIEASLATEEIRESRAALLYSLIGEYEKSNVLSEVPLGWDIDKVDVVDYKIENALPKIVEEAKNSQIVIISENHLKPQHRIFAKQLIIELAKIGYTALGMETLSSVDNNNNPLDEKLVERGYALNNPMTGTYTLEPRMANVVRTALQLDFDLFSYERTLKIKGVDRDIIQANNIIKYIEANPEKKIVILCGFHHVIESDRVKRGNVNWMAYNLKTKTGIDPLTIYQDHFTEKFKLPEHPFLKNISVEQPSVFTKTDGGIAQLTDEVDIEVIHPKTTYIKNRPHWLKENETYQFVEVRFDSENDTINLPVIAQAILFDESEGVPMDIIEVTNLDQDNYFVLPKGQYRIRISDGQKDYEYYQVVK